jgi:hypothetical protein
MRLKNKFLRFYLSVDQRQNNRLIFLELGGSNPCRWHRKRENGEIFFFFKCESTHIQFLREVLEGNFPAN